MNQRESNIERRAFLRSAASATGIIVAGCATTPAPAARAAGASAGEEEAEVTPGEDLMQEHGLLERILLIYEEGIRRTEQGETFDLAVITAAAKMVRTFVEDYHEKLEEQFVFPRLQKARRETELVSTLLQQHQRGRQLTDEILQRASAAASTELASLLRSFCRMYRPHAAREDTVLFPAFRGLVGRAAYHELGEQFEDKEHELFGERGFERNVMEVARLEAMFGVAELARFTP